MLLGRRALGRALAGAVVTSGAAARAEDAPLILGRFTTSYASDAAHKARAFNVELAAEAIHGKVIPRGGVFSFNDAVGERTAAFGFAKSVVIRDGMVAEGMGGGTCQVASTLHAAALLSGLDVARRAPHTRPSAYIRVGLDATVAYPAIDLKLKNPFEVPVSVRARAARGVLEVWLVAATVRPAVSLSSEILEWTPFPRVVERDRRLDEHTLRYRAFGIPGYRVRRTREVMAPDGAARRDVRIDVYPPVSEIVEVSPSFDESRLPWRRATGPGEGLTILDEGVLRPALVQLRPSTLVVLDNKDVTASAAP